MYHFPTRAALLALISCAALPGGALLLEVGNPDANPEARKLGAIVVARATACHEPAKSTVSAELVRLNVDRLERVPLKVTALTEAGTFAVTGTVPDGRALIELSVANPEYRDYHPRTLVRVEKGAVQWDSLRRFFSIPPSSEDVRVALAAGGH